MPTLPFISVDQMSLDRSEYREVRNAIKGLQPDCRNPVEAVLLGLGYSEEIVDEALYDHAEEEYAKLTAREQEEAGYRFWLDETPGRRLEVA